MPLASYFWRIGAVLLALIFLAGSYLPKPPPPAANAESPPPVIRLRSDVKLPERVVFDTRPTLVATVERVPSPAQDDAPSKVSQAPANPVENTVVADALAMMPRPEIHGPTAVDQPRRHRKAQYVAARTKRHARPQMMVDPRHGQIAWFGFRSW